MLVARLQEKFDTKVAQDVEFVYGSKRKAVKSPSFPSMLCLSSSMTLTHTNRVRVAWRLEQVIYSMSGN
ncbi:hypothetical protein M404DRAFT_683321 [Pisolithus tinctorius Marx 270]|uniref:Uncharacterized protein n=1 Tax=Pisolithus tinctorius Marx 270 TaxID=870435 RepID=A0A0C3PUQ2_PISTI|nr:hypothetical protein M404DRAFT_683321 [Pisolithus tinctorius Marx 270]